MSLQTLTEAGWLSGHNPDMLLDALDNRSSVRKYRLLLVTAICTLWSRLTEAERVAVAALEGYADGLTTLAEVERCRERAHDPRSEYWGTFDTVVRRTVELDRVAERSLSVCVGLASVHSSAVEAPGQQGRSWQQNTDTWSARQACMSRTVAIIRDLFVNPYRPMVLDRAWLRWNGGTVPALAAAIYAGQRFDDLPILADALEEAGCIDESALLHCREPGAHWRGCWLVDRILEKE